MNPEQDSARLANILIYLRAEGMTDDQLRQVHPTRQHNETFSAAIDYRQRPPSFFREPTLTYHKRLLFIESERRKSGGHFSPLIAAAISKFRIGEPQS